MIKWNDYITHVASNGRKARRFRDSCDTCGKDKGYIRRQRLGKDCHHCNSKKMATIGATHNGKSEEIAKNNSKLSSDMNSFWWIKRRQNKTYVARAHKVIRRQFSSSVRKRLRKRGSDKLGLSTFNILGYTVEDLAKHLEARFQPGMTWDNYGYWGWHIDHIKPDSVFTYLSIHDQGFKDSWALSNLQPMWRMDNIKKGNKYEYL